MEEVGWLEINDNLFSTICCLNQNISIIYIVFSMDKNESVIYAFTLRYTVMELMFLLLINVMITSTSIKLQKVFSLLLIYLLLLR